MRRSPRATTFWELDDDPRFELRRALGSGSFGAVYEVFDRERGAKVALKVLKRIEAEELYRFKQEFRALADTTHPNVVRLYELLGAHDRWFFTMELVEGTTTLAFVRHDDAPALAPTLVAGTRAALAHAASETVSPKDRREALTIAERAGRRLVRLDHALGEGFGQMALAGVASAKGDAGGASIALKRAQASFEAVGCKHRGAAAKWRRGTLIGGDEGRALVEEALAYFTGEGAKDPARVAVMLAPGK